MAKSTRTLFNRITLPKVIEQFEKLTGFLTGVLVVLLVFYTPTFAAKKQAMIYSS